MRSRWRFANSPAVPVKSSSQFALELELCTHRHLHDTRIASGCELPELRVHLCTSCIESGGGIEGTELRVVERVVDFSAELHLESLADREILEDRNGRSN